MILPGLVALLTAAGPLLRGSWDVWAQSLLHLAVVSGLCLWLLSRLAVGHVPLPSGRLIAWTAGLAALGAASAWSSPVRGLARPGWYNFLEALWLFPAMAAISKDQRSWIDEGIRLSGWVLMTLAFYQHFVTGTERPASALLNQNLYAGAILMLLPLAVEKGDKLLAIGLLWSLCWTRSVGAWLGLSMALLLAGPRVGRAGRWAAGAVALACAVLIYAKLGTPEVLHRWWWWKAAAAMAAERPLMGFGPGSFAYLLPVYAPSGNGELFSAYAHQHFLQMAAEFGLPLTLLWSAGVWRCVVRNRSHKRFGVVAVLIHSCWDYTLSVPSNFWLFSYFAASSIPDSPEGMDVPARNKPPALLFVLGLWLALGSRAWDQWAGDRAASSARAALEAGRLEEAGSRLLEARRRIPDDPEVPRMEAALEIRRMQEGAPASGWLAAAAALSRSAGLNPYRRSTWTELAVAYRRLGLAGPAEEALRRGEEAWAR